MRLTTRATRNPCRPVPFLCATHDRSAQFAESIHDALCAVQLSHLIARTPINLPYGTVSTSTRDVSAPADMPLMCVCVCVAIKVRVYHTRRFCATNADVVVCVVLFGGCVCDVAVALAGLSANGNGIWVGGMLLGCIAAAEQRRAEAMMLHTNHIRYALCGVSNARA